MEKNENKRLKVKIVQKKKNFWKQKNLLIWNIIILCFFVKEEELKKQDLELIWLLLIICYNDD